MILQAEVGEFKVDLKSHRLYLYKKLVCL